VSFLAEQGLGYCFICCLC